MMSVDLYVVRRCLAGVMMLVGAIGADTSALAQGVTVDETVLSVGACSNVFRTTACSTTSSFEWTAALSILRVTVSKEG